MIPLKPILLVLGKCLLVYCVLLMLYKVPAVQHTFSSYMRTVGKVATFAWDSTWEDNTAADPKKDIMVKLIYVREGRGKVQTSQTIQSWKTFFMPLAVLLALIFAYPSPKLGLLKSLLYSLLLLHLFYFIYVLFLVDFMMHFEGKSQETSLFYRIFNRNTGYITCLLYTSPSPRDLSTSRMPSSA